MEDRGLHQNAAASGLIKAGGDLKGEWSQKN